MLPRTVALLIALTAFAPCFARAEGVPPEVQARSLRERGARALEAGEFAEARALFERSLTFEQDAGARFGLGHAALETGAIVDAFIALNEALDADAAALSPEARATATALRDRAASGVGHIVVTARPAELTLTVDGRSPRIYRGKLVVLPGEHVLGGSAVGFITQERVVTVRAGRVARARLSLRRETPTERALREMFRGETMQGSELGQFVGPAGLGTVGVGRGQAEGSSTLGSGGDAPSRAPGYAFQTRIVRVQGGMSAGDVRRHLERTRSALDRCTRTDLAPTFRAGEVVIDFAFVRDGSPIMVRAASSDVGHPALEACLRDGVSRLRFPREEERAPTQVTLSIRVRGARP